MQSYLEDIWGLDNPRRYVPRVFIGVRMTNTDDDDIQKVCDECHNIAESVREYATSHGWDWDVVSAPEVLRPWAGGLPQDVNVHALNMRLLACADAVVAHAFKGGSVSLGGPVEYADGQLLPIAVFHFRHTRVSRKLLDRRPYSPFLRIYTCGDGHSDLYQRTMEWLDEFGSTIQTGPERRAERDNLHAALASSLLDVWCRLNNSSRRRVARGAVMTIDQIELNLECPGILADLPMAAYGRLADAIERALPSRLNPTEMKAWERWRDENHFPPPFARLVLDAVIYERRKEVLRRDDEELRHTGGWDHFAERYLRGEAGPKTG